MRFSELLDKAELAYSRDGLDVEVSSVVDDSRACEPGACFVAVRGHNADGHRFIPAAIEAGCSAIVCEDASAARAETPRAVIDSSRLAVGHLAQALRGWPARQLTNVGITGTNGKTTVAGLLEAILSAAGHGVGRLGTVGYSTGLREVPAETTTPSPIVLAEATDEMVRAGCSHLVMEVSSHALSQDRTAGVDFDVAVYTNLSGDHLDYHKTMDAYLAAKRRLFEQLSPEATAVINRDDASADAMAAAVRGRTIWYGLSPAADVRATIRRIDQSGIAFDLTDDRGTVRIQTPLIGRHNVVNCLAAATAARALSVAPEAVAKGLHDVAAIRGRLERVVADAPFQVFVDYAHTDDALSNVLASLRPITPGRIILVFGCGGDRDRGKRPRMARAAEQFADRIFVTSDNPRTEEPMAIIDEIVAGFGEPAGAKVQVEADRRSAIQQALACATAGDVVLIAGKGHECEQIIGIRRIHFDDVEVARELLAERERCA